MFMKTKKIISVLAFTVFALVCVQGFVSCKSESKAVATDSISKSLKSDKMADINVYADFPTDGKQCVVDSVRAYINDAMYSSFAELDTNGRPLAKDALYKGDVKDGRALVDFYADAYRKEMVKLHKEESIPPVMGPFVHYFSVKMNCDTTTFVTFLTSDYVFTGGAHGSEKIGTATFSKADGHMLGYAVDTTKTAQLQPMLRKYLTEYFSENDRTINENNLTDYLFIEGKTIPLPATKPYFTKDGLAFVYQQYEIAPYAAGQPSFTVPYKEIAPYLTKETFEIAEPFLKGK